MKVAPLLIAALASAAGDEIVARVDGVAIHRSTLERRLRPDSLGRTPRPEDALELLVDEALLAAEGRKLGLADSPAVKAEARRRLRAAAAEVMLDEVVAKAVVQEALLREMFHATSDFASFDSLVYGTREEAEAAFGRLRKDGDMAKEAPRAVIARVAANPHEAPPAMRAEIDPALARALFAARPGELLGPVALRIGWAVARLHRKEIGTDALFAERRPALERHAMRRIRAEARKHYVEQLRARSSVKLDEEFLRKLKGMEASARQLDHVIATVGGTPLRYRDVYPSIRALAAASGHAASPSVKIGIAWQVVEDLLLEDAAVERGYLSSPAMRALAPEMEREALATVTAERIQEGAANPAAALSRRMGALRERASIARGLAPGGLGPSKERP